MVLSRSRAVKHTPIGLEIGFCGVRAIQLRRAGDAWVALHTARCDRHHVDADEERNTDELECQIRTCLRQAEFRGRHVVAALNPPDVQFHALDLPRPILSKPNVNVAEVVRSEVLRLMGEPGRHAETAHWTLPLTTVPGPTAIGAAARREVIHHTLAACDRARMECVCVDVAATALCRFGMLLNQWGSDEIWGVLDAGCRQTRLVLCVDGVPVLVRTAGTGGGTWTKRIAEALDISTKSAEVHKREHGFAFPHHGSGRRAGDTSAAELGTILHGILRCDLNDLAAEVKRSYEYVLSCYPNRKVADLVLVGGGAALQNLPEFLTDTLGIPVRPASSYLDDESCRLRYVSGRQNPLEVFGLAVGLALGG